MNYHGQDWPAEVNSAFEKFVENGGGVVAYHATLFAFPKWDNWNKMIGMGWAQPTVTDCGGRRNANRMIVVGALPL